MQPPPPPIGERKIIRSQDIEIKTQVGPMLSCPMWMVNSYARAKKFGLVNVQRKLEDLATKQGCSL